MRELGCEDCHQIGGIGGTDGPDLTTIGSKHPVVYLRESIANPKANDTNSVMPDFNLPAADIQAIVVALLSQTDDHYPLELYPQPAKEERTYWATHLPDSLSSGAKLFQTIGCSHCHRTGDVGVAYARDLSGLGREKDSDAIYTYFKSADFEKDHGALELVTLRFKQMEALAAYLSQFKEELAATVVQSVNVTTQSEPPQIASISPAQLATTPSPPAPTRPLPSSVSTPNLGAFGTADVEEGAKLYKSKNCKLCHKSGGTGGTTGPKLDNVASRRTPEWIFYHFKDPQAISPGTRMPNNHFSDLEARALTAYVMTLK
jgi:mono/diheme cytochrome c family protein